MPGFAGQQPSGADEIARTLPLRLVRSQVIPPAPNRRASAVDWLPDFGGTAWISYGAASFFVISHLPSSISQEESLSGPFFQQVLEPPAPPDARPPADVNAVRWCPVRPSEGEVAAASGDCIRLYSPVTGIDSNSFCWRLSTAILQSFTVGAIEWTQSGDGLVVGGIAVVLWTRKNLSWEVSWKMSAKVPQALISTTWFAEGLVASSSDSSISSSKDRSIVYVYNGHGKLDISKTELHHPKDVLMIQWRPCALGFLSKIAVNSWRDVLLTCCSDGAVRFWGETDINKAKKINKDDHMIFKRSFHVIAVIEINQRLKGELHREVFISWAMDWGYPVLKGEVVGSSSSLKVSGLDGVGECEWLVSAGPGSYLTFWAVLFLDDTSPLRFPRVQMCKKFDLMDFKSYDSINAIISVFNEPILLKSIILRKQASSPPDQCYLLWLLPDNSVRYLQLHNISLEKNDNAEMDKSFISFASGFLNQDGHTGKILQLAVHPHTHVFELAASLDSNGSVLLWSLSTISNSDYETKAIVHPAWKFLGKIVQQDSSTTIQYCNLKWVSLSLDEKCFLLLVYPQGIDCYTIQLPRKSENFMYCKILTIPFATPKQEGPPSHIYTTTLSSSAKDSSFSGRFVLSALWGNEFRAASWEVDLHWADASQDNYFPTNLLEKGQKVNSFVGKNFLSVGYLCSLSSSDHQSPDEVTTVVAISNHYKCYTCENSYFYYLAIGYFDGTLKLWQLPHARNSSYGAPQCLSWKLVGALTAHQGPVSAIASSNCGTRVATASYDGHNCITTIHLWDSLCLINGGGFLLEDKISLNGPIVVFEWLTLGNGRLLLVICMPHKLSIYSQRIFNNLDGLHPDRCKEAGVWFPFAFSPCYPAPQAFLLGPMLAPVLVHEKHISVFSPWLFQVSKEYDSECSGMHFYESEEKPFAIYTERGVQVEGNHRNSQSPCLKVLQKPCNSNVNRFYSILDLDDVLHHSLPIYHPISLIQNLNLGNWKRTYTILKHLIESLKDGDKSSIISDGCDEGNSSQCGILDVHLSAYIEDGIHQKLASKENNQDQNIALGKTSVQFPSELNLFQFGAGGSMFHFPESDPSNGSRNSGLEEFTKIVEKSHDAFAKMGIEENQILSIVDLLVEITDTSHVSAYGSLDGPARRFWVAARLEHFIFFRNFGRMPAAEEVIISSRTISWAFHSDYQELLFDSVLSSESSWIEMRSMGVGYWFTNVTQLRKKMEKLARAQYFKRKDPKDCTLIYLSLGRIQVLVGLFKMSKDEKDKLLVQFLSRNFKEEKNKAAALKNAYVLMGRHQLELAVAFFLLGGDPSSAVSVCAKNLGDEQLALVICRLLEGYGGPLERQIISNLLLPNATMKADYWLSSLLEWILGNYSLSIKNLIDSQEPVVKDSGAFCNLSVSRDPTIGLYCSVLADKTSLRNSIGDHAASVLSKFGLFVASRAFRRSGLPLEALECRSSSFCVDGKDQIGSSDDEVDKVLHGVLHPFSIHNFNWLNGEIVSCIESNLKVNIALEYLSELLGDSLDCIHAKFAAFELPTIPGYDTQNFQLHMKYLKKKLNQILFMIGQKLPMGSTNFAIKLFEYSCSRGFVFFGHFLLEDFISRVDEIDSHDVYYLTSAFDPHEKFLERSWEISYLLARYVVLFNFVNLTTKSRNKGYSGWWHPVIFCLQDFIQLLCSINLILDLSVPEGLSSKICASSDFLRYCIYFASSWLRMDIKGLIPMSFLITDISLFDQPPEDVAYQLMNVVAQTHHVSKRFDAKKHLVNSDENISHMLQISGNERWLLIGACLWFHLSRFSKHLLEQFMHSDYMDEKNRNLPFLISEFITTSLTSISSSLIKHYAALWSEKLLDGSSLPSLDRFDEQKFSQRVSALRSYENNIFMQISDNENAESMFNILEEMSVNRQEIISNMLKDRFDHSIFEEQHISASWFDIFKASFVQHENRGFSESKKETGDKSVNYESGRTSMTHNEVFEKVDIEMAKLKETEIQRKNVRFQKPCEILRRSGELIESICYNSLDEQQVVLSSNRKGLFFFNWKSGNHVKGQNHYVWAESDWPQVGWATDNMTQSSMSISRGKGPRDRSRAQIGLGGVVVDSGSLSMPGRDLTGGGAFGIPGYAGIGASGLGWGEPYGFEGYLDPPAISENIRSTAISCHPLMPLFLVGSRSTLIYLWEFGRDRATATYGIPHAANGSPYSFSSTSAVKFDNYGHRFATAALDGTVSSWQLEVGERSNLCRTESAVCFSNYAADLSYMSASGSVLAVAGHNSNGLNVILWDTLAPNTTSGASILCHEGGARSVSVIDHAIGSGSISPLIVSGGKVGDVGVHDFRYVATGRSKRNRYSADLEFRSASNFHAENTNGMIWYIPSAHSGAITRITTIPNTSLFLTGSKDGDVKLWDAKSTKLIFHWQKLHDRHTFLQPNAHGIGGVVRAAVTDIQVLSSGFLTCGGDGSVKLVRLG